MDILEAFNVFRSGACFTNVNSGAGYGAWMWASELNHFSLVILCTAQYTIGVIRTFRDKELEKLFHREYSKTRQDLQRRAGTLMRVMNSAAAEQDLRAIPGGHYERLKGDRKGQSSLQVSGNWRLCFVWDEDDGDVYDLELVDYH
jgi:proteic killer suppression protein